MKKTMTKIEEVKVQTIDNVSQPKGTEKIEMIYPEAIQTPDYSYGNGQNSIDGPIGVRNLAVVASTGSYNDLLNKPTIPTVNTPVMGSFTITATGNIAVTGVGYTPKYVKFLYYAATGRGEGEMTATQMRAYDPRTGGTVTTDNIYIRDGADAVIARTQFVSMDSDGFTINCSFRSANLTVYYTTF